MDTDLARRMEGQEQEPEVDGAAVVEEQPGPSAEDDIARRSGMVMVVFAFRVPAHEAEGIKRAAKEAGYGRKAGGTSAYVRAVLSAVTIRNGGIVIEQVLPKVGA